MASYNLEKVNFLVIDDNKHMRNLVMSILAALGAHSCRQAGGVDEALDVMKEFRTDIVICDWRMDPIDGLEFVRRLRTDKDSIDRFVPVILLTAYADMRRVHEARDCGVNEFVAKPVSAKALYTHIRSIIKTPREYVETGDYFGPDRRRKELPFQGSDRRAPVAVPVKAG